MSGIPTQRVFDKLDEYFSRNDYDGAERHLLYWVQEAEAIRDARSQLAFWNELAGLYRKVGKEAEALRAVERLLALVERMGIDEDVGAGTTYINCATVYKAFGRAAEAVPLFEHAKRVYEAALPRGDKRFGGLYNNMALALVDLRRFEEAYAFYDKAIAVMQAAEDGDLEVAITYLNVASAKDAEHGAVESEAVVEDCLEKARRLLDGHTDKNGYYAFVCEKCAPTFGYYGHFMYEKELMMRAREIYERA